MINNPKYKGYDWNPEVVYKVYCNDDLNTLPLSILEDMKKYLENIISNKYNEVE